MSERTTTSTVASPANRICPRCGVVVGGFGLEGLCPACLIREGLEELTAVIQPAASPAGLSRQFGDYELQEEIARGGMGVIYRAQQVKLNRTLAVKMILAGQHAGVSELARFRAEAQTAAQLQHPNIVAIHEVGECDGLPFFSMDYVAGQNLAQLVGNTPLPAKRAAAYLQKIAAAVQYAHQRGVLHRDLKPSNVLIDSATDEPRVTDFGLAKRMEGDASLTMTGQVLGSPGFMPPEQATGKQGDVGPASDVYSLGAILYHLLTGRPPFVADTVPATLRMVVETEVVSPRLLNASVPRDLETICLKCLEKEPQRRYATAQELVEELGRYQRDEPIQARPASKLERTWRWCRRNRALATAASAIVLLLLIVAIGSTLAALRINREKNQADAARQLAQSNEARADEQKTRAEELAASERRRLYATSIGLAQQMFEEGDVARVEQLLNNLVPANGEEDLRGFEWRYLWGLCHSEFLTLTGHVGIVRTVGFSADGSEIFSGGSDGVLCIWKTAKGKLQTARTITTNAIYATALSADGQSIVVGNYDGSVVICDSKGLGDAKQLVSWTNSAGTALFSPDGRLLLTAPGRPGSGGGTPATRFVPTIREGKPLLWDWATKSVSWDFLPFQATATSAAISPTNDLIVLAATTWISIYDSNHRNVRIGLTNFPGNIYGPAFSPDGRNVCVPVWDPYAASGDIILIDAVKARNAIDLLAGQSTVEKRELVVSYDDFQISSMRLDDCGPVLCAKFSPDGRLLATGGADQLLRVWDTKTGRVMARYRGHKGPVVALAFSPDSTKVASASWDSTVKVWDVSRKQESQTHITGANFSVAFSPDSQRLFSGGTALSAWDVVTGSLLVLYTNANWKSDAGVLPSIDSDSFLTVGPEKFLTRWNATNRQNQQAIRAPASLYSFASSADYGTLAIAWRDQTVRLYDAKTFAEKLSLRGITNSIVTLDFTPDGKTMFTGGARLRKWSTEDGTEQGNYPFYCLRLKVSPDGRTLAQATSQFDLRVLDLKTMRESYRLRAHKDEIYGMAFSADSKTVATASWDGTVKLWHASTGLPLITLKSEGGVCWSVAFSRDGKAMAFGSGTARPTAGRLTLLRAPSMSEIEAPR